MIFRSKYEQNVKEFFRPKHRSVFFGSNKWRTYEHNTNPYLNKKKNEVDFRRRSSAILIIPKYYRHETRN